MPVIKSLSNKYRFFFYSNEQSEPMHVHVEKDSAKMKIWLEDGSVAYNKEFGQKEVNEIVKLVTENRKKIEEVWNEHFGK
ncbi:MAG: DUF4160 domain-containing protein [Chlorobiales bacterium]|nr:DUF4160 domain-containing protein [Chlorobiales bacterium]